MASFLCLLLSLFAPAPDDTPGGPTVQNAPITVHLAENGTRGVDGALTG
jgi:hypothetical protein